MAINAASTIPSTDRALALVLGSFTVLVWAGTPAGFVYAVQGFDAYAAGALRTAFAAPIAVIALMTFAKVRWRTFFQRDVMLLLLIAGAGGYGLYPILLAEAIARTSTGHAGLILAVLPIQTAAIAFALDRERPGRLWMVGVAIAAAGQAVLFLYDDGGNGATLEGDLICLVSTLFAAAGYIAGSKLGAKLGFAAGTFACIFVGAVTLSPIIILTVPHIDWGGVPSTAWAGVAYLSLMSVIFGYMAWYAALAKGGVQSVAPLQFAQPLITLVIGVVLFQEVITLNVVIAAAMILSGVWLTRRRS